jgi:hypothetical protein
MGIEGTDIVSAATDYMIRGKLGQLLIYNSNYYSVET